MSDSQDGKEQAYADAMAFVTWFIEDFIQKNGRKPTKEEVLSAFKEEFERRTSSYDDVVEVDFFPRFSSFGYKGRLHLEYHPATGVLNYSGWNLNDYQIDTYKAFLSDVNNIRNFFNPRLAYSVEGEFMLDTGPYTLTMKWRGQEKTISVGVGATIPYEHPFY